VKDNEGVVGFGGEKANIRTKEREAVGKSLGRSGLVEKQTQG